jgi:ankyrin repeat protein
MSKIADQSPDLCLAIKEGSVAKISSLLQSGLLPSFLGDETPLTYAILFNYNIDVFNTLINAKADVNTANKNGAKPIELALEKRNFPLVMLLLEHKATFKSDDEKKSFLQRLARGLVRYGYKDTLITLLTKYKDIDLEYEYEDGQTLLMLAIKQGHYSVAKALLANGAKIDTQTKLKDCALAIAIREKSPDSFVETLVNDYKANTWLVLSHSQAILHLAIRYKRSISLVKTLLGIEPKRILQNARAIALKAEPTNTPETATLIMPDGQVLYVKVSNLITKSSSEEKSRGYSASSSTSIVKQSDINKQDDSGDTPLMYAIEYVENAAQQQQSCRGNPYFYSRIDQYYDQGQQLLKQDSGLINMEALTDRGKFVADVCYKGFDNLEYVKLLFKQGANAELANNKGVTPLMKAVEKCQLDVVKTILATFSNKEALKKYVDRQDKAGNSAFMFAVSVGNISLMEVLYNSGADLGLANKQGQLADSYTKDRRVKSAIAGMRAKTWGTKQVEITKPQAQISQPAVNTTGTSLWGWWFGKSS